VVEVLLEVVGRLWVVGWGAAVRVKDLDDSRRFGTLGGGGGGLLAGAVELGLELENAVLDAGEAVGAGFDAIAWVIT
jgi:hypothetical protein